jgi:hypothetical protein
LESMQKMLNRVQHDIILLPGAHFYAGSIL